MKAQVTLLLVLTCILPSSIFAAPAVAPDSGTDSSASETSSASWGKCSSIAVRPEWRTLTSAQKAQYMTAVKCLASKKSILKNTPSTRLYDDFEYVHNTAIPTVHWVASFLPWHRWYIFTYQTAIQACGWTGPIPHWDWTQDSADITKAPIWGSDPTTAFGTNGTYTDPNDTTGLGSEVVTDGAFANWQVYLPTPHKLERSFGTQIPPPFILPGHPYANQYYIPSYMSSLYAKTTFEDFRLYTEGGSIYQPPSPAGLGPHAAIHLSVGGDLKVLGFSGNEPVFFLHHGHIDYVWAKWQSLNATRLTEYTGNRIQNQTANDAQLSDKLPMYGLGPDVPVSTVMNTEAWPLCYTYAFLPNS